MYSLVEATIDFQSSIYQNLALVLTSTTHKWIQMTKQMPRVGTYVNIVTNTHNDNNNDSLFFIQLRGGPAQVTCI